jgi:hypothetical protein
MTHSSLLGALAALLVVGELGCGGKASAGPSDGGGCAAPVVSFRNPTEGAVVGGPVAVQLNVSSVCPVSKVEVFADGQSFATMTVPPFSIFWDTSALTNANVELHAVATTNDGVTGEVAIEVTTEQPCQAPRDCPPRARILAPTANSTVCGKVTIYAEGFDDHDVPQVTFSVDGQPIGSALTKGPYLQDWDASTAAPGAHVLQAEAKDSTGNIAQGRVHVRVAADCKPQAPVIAFACPPPDPKGQVFCAMGMLPLCADARSASGIASVSYRINGLGLGGTAPRSPQWNATWDTSKYPDGTYQVQAVAVDSAGVATTEAQAFRVANMAPCPGN